MPKKNLLQKIKEELPVSSTIVLPVESTPAKTEQVAAPIEVATKQKRNPTEWTKLIQKFGKIPKKDSDEYKKLKKEYEKIKKAKNS